MDTNQYRDITMCVYVHHTQTHTHTDTHTGIYLWFLQRNRKDLETKECSYKGWRRKAEASEALLNTSFYQFALCNHTILYTGKTEGKKALIPQPSSQLPVRHHSRRASVTRGQVTTALSHVWSLPKPNRITLRSTSLPGHDIPVTDHLRAGLASHARLER